MPSFGHYCGLQKIIKNVIVLKRISVCAHLEEKKDGDHINYFRIVSCLNKNKIYHITSEKAVFR